MKSSAVIPATFKLLYNRAESAAILSLSPRSVDYLIADGRLEAKRVGGRVLVSFQALQAFANSDQTSEIVKIA